MADHDVRRAAAANPWDTAPQQRGVPVPVGGAGGTGGNGLAGEAVPHKNVIYLGLNTDKNAREIESKQIQKYAKEHGTMAGVMTGNGNDESQQGIVSWTDHRTNKKVEFDLRTADGLHGYMDFLDLDEARPEEMKLPEAERQKKIDARMKAIEDIFRGKDNGNGVREGGLMMDVRDEIGQYLEVLQMVEMGYMSMDRLIVSGHSNGNFVYSEEGDDRQAPGIKWDKLAALTALFPKAQHGIKDVMLSACHTNELFKKDGEVVADTRGSKPARALAPSASVHMAYDGKSPAAQEAANQITRGFLPATEKADDLADAKRMAARLHGTATVE